MDYLPRLEDMEFLPHLKLLHWNSYPGTSLPPTRRPEFLIELNMPSSKFEKLWEGIQVGIYYNKVDLSITSCVHVSRKERANRDTSALIFKTIPWSVLVLKLGFVFAVYVKKPTSRIIRPITSFSSAQTMGRNHRVFWFS